MIMMTIKEYRTGTVLAANVEIDTQQLNDKSQMPEGVIQAKFILSAWQLEDTQISPETTVYCEQTKRRAS